MKKRIYLNGKESHYEIEDTGVVFNLNTGKVLKGTLRGGYHYYDLRFEGNKYSKGVHRLVAEAFLPNPKEVVHHINNDPLDNNLSNLEWVTYSENNLNVNKTAARDNISATIEYKDDETWKTCVQNEGYLISSYGRVKNIVTNKILKGAIKNSGYHEYCLTKNGVKTSYLGHRLVYQAFFPEEKLDIINHINGKKADNRIDNLENVTSAENNEHALRSGLKALKKVGQYTLDGTLLRTFDSCAAAARYVGIRPQSLNHAVRMGTKSCGYFWSYIEN